MTRAFTVILLALSMSILVFDTAHAQIETLVMPGEVIQGHAELEAECDNCHEAFARNKQRGLCLDCHEDIAADIEAQAGFHGRFRQARQRTCARCHTDHEGRDFDIVGLDESAFDHTYTDFELSGAHTDVTCTDCHEPGKKHRDTPQQCTSCHEADSVHEGTLGDDCGSCHAPSTWTDVDFDHSTTGHSLLGKHNQAACLDCHSDRTFEPAPTTCIDCHADDDVHDGRSGSECGNCHQPTGWNETSFKHGRDTRFILDGRHAELSCSDCHSEDPFADALEPTCAGCHGDDDNHDGHFGGKCESCHATSNWPDTTFIHAQFTGHELLGSHTTTACESCHVEPLFDVALDPGCNSCHASDDPHDGTQGTACGDCHNESGWREDVFFDHDLTAFPLLGSHADEACEACHTSQVFRDASVECAACHGEEDPHKRRFGDACDTCHNPVGWSAWMFDHDLQTSFELLGSHKTVECDACHRRPLKEQLRLGSRCADCHRTDDIHDGEFGADCGRCHASDSFRNVRSIR
jgi:hypothetical protein